MNITKEQTNRFWEWCGFRLYAAVNFEINGYWYMPTKDDEIDYYMPELEHITLDNIYKYAVPILQYKGYIIELTAYEHCKFGCRIQNVITEKINNEIINENPVECLFNAIYEVIENESK